MTRSADAIDRILVIDDAARAREGYAYSIEDLGITPVPEAGPITDLDHFVAGVQHRAPAVLCAYRLKSGCGYSSFNGDKIVGSCYRHGIPGLLGTQYTDITTAINRRFLRFIPAVLRTVLQTRTPSVHSSVAARMNCKAPFIPPGNHGERWCGSMTSQDGRYLTCDRACMESAPSDQDLLSGHTQ